jgi:hypothetical protein
MPDERRTERLAALGAVGVAAAVLVVYVLWVFVTRPQPTTAGIDRTNAVLTWISSGLIALAVIAVHLALARQLWRGTQYRP